MEKQEWEGISVLHVTGKGCFRTHTTYKVGKEPDRALHKTG